MSADRIIPERPSDETGTPFLSRASVDASLRGSEPTEAISEAVGTKKIAALRSGARNDPKPQTGEGGTVAEQAPRPASTVVLVRERESGLQVYLLKRSARSAFFPGKYVFPGGTLDMEDREADFWLNHADLDREGIEKRFGLEPGAEALLGYAVAAVRETFEEAGVLLARKGEGTPVDPAPLCARRGSSSLERGWFKKQAAEEGWILSLSRLCGWSRWITPEAFQPRFDTRFFLAVMPEGQACAPDMQETTQGLWIEPQPAIEANLRGSIPLSPPTLVTLQELIGHGLELRDSNRSWGEPRLPRLIRLSRGALILEPWDPKFHEPTGIDEDDLERLILPAGSPFSRIWLHEGVWRPVGL